MAYDDKGTDKEVKSLKARHPEKPPAGIKAELDAMKQGAANAKGMEAHEKRRLAKGGACYARGGGVEQRGKTKGTVVKMARGGGVELRGKTRGKVV